MEEELLKIIYDYSFNYKLGDETFIDEINQILFNHYNINEEEVKIVNYYNDTSSKTLASYFVNQRKLSFNIEKIYAVSKKKVYSFRKESDEYLFHNFFILACIIHEYIHVLQHREKSELDRSLISNDKKRLLDYSFLFNDDEVRRKLNINNYNYNYNYYRIYHDYFPTERMAELEAKKQILELLRLDYTFNDILKDFYRCKYFNMLIFGYDMNNTLCRETSALEEYLFNIDLYYLYKNFSFYDANYLISLKKAKQNYSLHERLLYGFPIDLEEELDLLKRSREATLTLKRHI